MLVKYTVSEFLSAKGSFISIDIYIYLGEPTQAVSPLPLGTSLDRWNLEIYLDVK